MTAIVHALLLTAPLGGLAVLMGVRVVANLSFFARVDAAPRDARARLVGSTEARCP